MRQQESKEEGPLSHGSGVIQAPLWQGSDRPGHRGKPLWSEVAMGMFLWSEPEASELWTCFRRAGQEIFMCYLLTSVLTANSIKNR